ncbi:hypothetical protein BYT27DRAFT_7195372 [Phlegmacium glaucopus]|nr:hypothetical protein BYT27DRAFT_7195372 [Phlegmacium glaucopus]
MVSPTFTTAFSRFIFTLLIWLQWIQISFALVRGDSACKHSICVSATLEADTVTYEMTSLTKSNGWMALGFGRHMIHTHSVIMWHNQDGTTTLSQRYASGYFEPNLDDAPPRLATIAKPNNLIKRPANSTTYTFQIPANRTLLQSKNPSESLVFAHSSVLPDKAPDATLTQHNGVGYLTFDLTKEFVPPVYNTPAPQPKPATGKLTSNEKVIVLHASLVSLGFLVLLPAGSLIGRWGRAFTPKWFKAHWVSNMAIALPVITVGVLLGPVIVYMKPTFRIHLANSHEVCGVILLFLYYAQVALGHYIHERFTKLAKIGPVTHPHPPVNILHICLGVSIIGLSFFQVRSGLQWWETLTGRPPITPWAYPLWHVWIVLLPLAYFGGYVLLPRQLRLEQEARYIRLPDTATEANAQSSQLLQEEGEAVDHAHDTNSV